jgi:hypothetical protein
MSAHARIASLVLLWALVLTSPLLGPLLVPLVGLRLTVSGAQMVWNTTLGRRMPLDSRTKADWWLFGLTFLAACVASELGTLTGEPHSPLLLSLVAMPYSAIQLRTCRRAFIAMSRGPEGVQVVPFPTVSQTWAA